LAAGLVGGLLGPSPQTAGAGLAPWTTWPCAQDWQQTFQLPAAESGDLLEVSRDGTMVVFSATDDLTGENPDGEQRLFVLDRTTDNVTQLPDTDAPIEEIQVNDDGSAVFLALDSRAIQRVTTADSQVATLPITGTALTIDGPGEHVAVGNQVLDVQDDTSETISSPDGHPIRSMALSSDASRLLVVTEQALGSFFEVDHRLYLIERDGGAVLHQVDPQWAPGPIRRSADATVAVVGRDDESYEVWDLDGETLVANRGGSDVTVLADGGTAYVVSRYVPGEAHAVAVPSAAESSLPVDAFGLGGEGIATSGSGDVVAVRPSTGGVFLVDPSDGSSERIASAPRLDAQASVTDDAGTTAFYVASDPRFGNDDGGSELWAASAAGIERLTDLGVGWYATDIDVSSDGEEVVFLSNADLTGGNPAHRLEVFLLERGSPATYTQVATGGRDRLGAPAISGDGATIAFTSARDLGGTNADGSDELFVYDVASLTTQQASSGSPVEYPRIGRPALDHGGDLVALRANIDPFGQNPEEVQQLFLYRPETEQLSQVTTTPGTVLRNTEDTSVSADGSLVLYGSAVDPDTGLDSGGERARLHDVAAGTTTSRLAIASSEGPWLVADGTSVWGQYGAQVRRWNLATDAEVRHTGRFDATSADGHRQVHLQDSRQTITGTTCWTFPDVPPAHPFWTDVEWAADRAIVAGYADQTFRPSATVTRQAMAAFLYRLAGASAPAPTTAPFTDVSTSHPFATEIAWAAGEDITTGYPDDTYRPSAVVTRQATAAFLHRLVDPADDTPPTAATFDDVGTGHPFFTEIEWAAGVGITTGYPDDTYRPSAVVTRQATAAFLHRTQDLL
jgi:Tol biopolymer transport system component